LLLLAVLLPLGASAAEKEWRFRVYLDDKEIGYHSFALEEQGLEKRISIEADFEYKLLFLSLFEYSHRNTEVWSGNCLEAIEAETVANGEYYELRGIRSDGAFQLTAPQIGETLPPCVMTFAYWNPSFLEQERLLDPQTGELLDVEVSEPRPEQLAVKGTELTARHYRLEADGLGISLWYSADDEWLGLEADALGGRKLRYELM
jgi:hypothetical protein